MQKKEHKIYLKKIGSRIREIRVGQSLSLLYLSVRMENHPEQLSRVENGKYNVTVITLKKIANALGVEVGEFLVS